MKKSLRNLLVLLAILVLGGVIYFVASFFKKNEPFVSNRQNLNIKGNFTRNEKNISIFKNISSEEDDIVKDLQLNDNVVVERV